MRIIDTHAHIFADQFSEDIDDVVCRAKEAGIERILLPNVDVDSIPELHLVVQKYPGYCLPMMGLHPTNVDQNWKEKLSSIRSAFDKNGEQYIAVGEIGIDLYWDKTFLKEQQTVFEEQLRWSIEFDLPVAIHTREATPEAIESIKKVGKDKLRGVFHSFVGTTEELKLILSLENFYIGINGVITYKNSKLRDVLKSSTDLSKIIIETDSPYLPPVPYRGKRNEPAYTVYILEELAKIYDISIDDIGDKTTNNAIKLFNLAY